MWEKVTLIDRRDTHPAQYRRFFGANGWIPEANSGKVDPMIWEENISSALSGALVMGICFRRGKSAFVKKNIAI